MKEIDEGIKAALRDAALDSGSILKLSRRFGVSHSTVLFWNSGRTRRIDGDVWREKVYPVIAPYLKNHPGGAKLSTESASAYGMGCRQNAMASCNVPIIGMSQTEGFDPVFESLSSYARSCKLGEAPFTMEFRDGYFALKVEGECLEPEFPEGTLLLVAGNDFVQDGDIAVARLRKGGKLIVRRAKFDGGRQLRLEPINHNGESFAWDRVDERGFVEWMHPVIEAKVDLRARRLAAFGIK